MAEGALHVNRRRIAQHPTLVPERKYPQHRDTIFTSIDLKKYFICSCTINRLSLQSVGPRAKIVPCLNSFIDNPWFRFSDRMYVQRGWTCHFHRLFARSSGHARGSTGICVAGTIEIVFASRTRRSDNALCVFNGVRLRRAIGGVGSCRLRSLIERRLTPATRRNRRRSQVAQAH
jgi:hypothetical protein